MTPAENDIEWRFRYEERIALLRGDGDPTNNHKLIAAREANAAMLALAEEDNRND